MSFVRKGTIICEGKSNYFSNGIIKGFEKIKYQNPNRAIKLPEIVGAIFSKVEFDKDYERFLLEIFNSLKIFKNPIENLLENHSLRVAIEEIDVEEEMLPERFQKGWDIIISASFSSGKIRILENRIKEPVIVVFPAIR